jgi:hypothetical protein
MLAMGFEGVYLFPAIWEMVIRFQKNLRVRPSLVQIHRLGNSAGSVMCGRVLRNVRVIVGGDQQ